MMITKFAIGDTVTIRAKVERIEVDENGIQYTLRASGDYFTAWEDDIEGESVPFPEGTKRAKRQQDKVMTIEMSELAKELARNAKD